MIYVYYYVGIQNYIDSIFRDPKKNLEKAIGNINNSQLVG